MLSEFRSVVTQRALASYISLHIGHISLLLRSGGDGWCIWHIRHSLLTKKCGDSISNLHASLLFIPIKRVTPSWQATSCRWWRYLENTSIGYKSMTLALVRNCPCNEKSSPSHLRCLYFFRLARNSWTISSSSSSRPIPSLQRGAWFLFAHSSSQYPSISLSLSLFVLAFETLAWTHSCIKYFRENTLW